jgi:3-oxoacyl-[acyl-carrier-protein] synthase II
VSTAVITGWSAVSPYGVGREAFAAGVRAGGRAAVAELDPAVWQVPRPQAHLVPGFELRGVLGRKGTRSMDRVSALAVTAVRELFDSDEVVRDEGGDDTALVLGTTTGSVKGMLDITRDTLLQEKPYHIDTGRIPNAIMNSAAAQCAIWHQMFGPNTTVAGGRVAGLFALQYAARLLQAGRAAMVLCGGAEEFTEDRAWLEHLGGGPDANGPLLGEGCGLLTVEPAPDGAAGDRPGLAEVVGIGLGVYDGAEVSGGLERCLRRTLDRAGIPAGEVWAVCSAAGPGALGSSERSALDAVFGSGPVSVLDGQPWGDAGAVTATFQVAALLSYAQAAPAAAGRPAVVTAVDRDGLLGCAVLRMVAP